MENQAICPICKTPIKASHEQRTTGDYQILNCPRCGRYKISRTLIVALPSLLVDEDQESLISHTIRKMQGGKEIPFLNSYTIEAISKNKLPSISDQMNILVLWLGDNSNPGHFADQNISSLQSVIGAKSPNGVDLILSHLNGNGLVEFPPPTVFGGEKEEEEEDKRTIKLTISGWDYYEKIRRGSIMSRKAFMAMQYGDQDLDLIVMTHFKPAVKATGFDLYRLDEEPRAGLIDDRLRVEIRTSRFLISDLTHKNLGAYWEAGFAEGLGKPVIYTCEKSRFETQKTHFDTNHHLTIIWDKENLEEAAKQLKATIRATLPDEAILADAD